MPPYDAGENAPTRLSARAILTDGMILACLICLFYAVFLTGGAISAGADLINLFLPMKAFTRQAFAQGVIPLWNPYTFCGAPFLATMQAAVLYPFNLPAIAFDNVVLGVNLYRLLHLWWMGLGVCVFLRVCHEAPRALAIGCSLALPCGQFAASHLDHLNQLAAIAWFPWWMTALWFCLRCPSLRVAAALGVCGGMQWLAGHPQQVIFTLLLSGGYILAGTVFGRGRSTRDWRRVWACAAGGVALAAGLAFAQILPAAELSPLSLRVLDDFRQSSSWPPEPGAPPRYAARYALHPKLLALAVNPYAFEGADPGGPALEGLSESRSYVGWLILAGAGLGMGLAFWRRHRELMFWTGATALCFLFAMGDATPIHWLASALLPPLRHFRAPPRILFIAMFALCVLASAGWRGIVETLRARARVALWIAWAAGWAAVLATFADLRLAFAHRSTARPIDARALAAPPYWPSLAQSAQGYRVFRLMPNDGDAYLDTRARGIVERMRRLQPNSNVAAAIATTDGYEEGLLPLARTLDFDVRFHRNLFSPTPDAILLGLLNAKYVMSEAPVSLPRASAALGSGGADGVDAMAAKDGGGAFPFHRNEWALPRVVRFEPLAAAIDFECLDGGWYRSRGASPPSLNLSAAVMDYLKPDYRGEAAARRIEERFKEASSGVSVTMRDCDRLDVRIGDHPSNPTRLALLQAPYPGWDVDEASSPTAGRRAAVVPLCAIASRTEVHGGSARLVYRPWSFRLGLFVSLLSWAALLAVVVASPRKAPADGGPTPASELSP